ncbi:MAG: hypothetical protein FWG13_06170 [Leptospirales bacterium]|nr:hypothetical protein [Leptospirales bacterium]
MESNFFYKKPSNISEYNLIFTGTVAEKKQSVAEAFEFAGAYYSSIDGISHEELDLSELFSCFAFRIASFIINFSGNKKYALSKENGLPKSFYDKCLKAARTAGEMADVPNNDILIISMKQMMHILRSAGIAKIENGKAFMEPYLMSGQTFYFLILHAFWNTVKWRDIFPSDTEAADFLMRDRTILADIMLRRGGRMEINDLANEFFDMTGFAAVNDIHAVSFIDFYMFFWLKNFGIINYHHPGGEIFIELTGTGEKLLSYVRK